MTSCLDECMPVQQSAVSYTDVDLLPLAKALAEKLHLPVSQYSTANVDFLLVYTPQRLELHQPRLTRSKPLYIDFSDIKMQRRLTQENRSLLARACAVKTKQLPRIVDATAGLARDAFLLACLGCRVCMLERSPIISSLLHDALQRVPLNLVDRLQMIAGDALHYLDRLSGDEKPDIILLDPMYPKRRKSALVKQEMRLLRDLVGLDEDAPQLFSKAMTCAKKRVVVKRARLAEPITQEIAPDIVYRSRLCRFDVYLTSVN